MLASPTSCGNWFSHCNSMFRFVADVSYVAIAMVGTYASRCVITIIRYACFEFEFTNVGTMYLALYSLMQATISKNNCKSIKAS